MQVFAVLRVGLHFFLLYVLILLYTCVDLFFIMRTLKVLMLFYRNVEGKVDGNVEGNRRFFIYFSSLIFWIVLADFEYSNTARWQFDF